MGTRTGYTCRRGKRRPTHSRLMNTPVHRGDGIHSKKYWTAVERRLSDAEAIGGGRDGVVGELNKLASELQNEIKFWE
ncbi:hypothetical protein TPB0596_39970 [Tsukamurella pulmonis]|nr:hypothetical protein TPB0596_39970 [Tsukamurella pulmonis]